MEKKELKNRIVAGMRPVEIVGLMLGILLAMDVTSHLPVAYSNMLRALEESTAAEDLLHQLGSQARYISIFAAAFRKKRNQYFWTLG